tara:strand:+ start:563 stop:799 length:237 start_codon:yes stop_codon:yes gene_type:complete
MYLTGEIDHIINPRNIPHCAIIELRKVKLSEISIKESLIIPKINPGKNKIIYSLYLKLDFKILLIFKEPGSILWNLLL